MGMYNLSNWLTELFDDDNGVECSVDLAKYVETEELKLIDIIEKADAINEEFYNGLQFKVDDYLLKKMYERVNGVIEKANFIEIDYNYEVITELQKIDSTLELDDMEGIREQLMFLKLRDTN